jgi:hypothetical protein
MHPLGPDAQRVEAGVVARARQRWVEQLLMAALQPQSDERRQIRRVPRLWQCEQPMALLLDPRTRARQIG